MAENQYQVKKKEKIRVLLYGAIERGNVRSLFLPTSSCCLG